MRPTCPAHGVPLHFLLRPIRMIYAPILSVFDPFRPAPIIRIFGQPAPLSGGFPPLLAQNLGTVMLAWVTARIRLEPLFAAETFFAAMLELHPAFLTKQSWHSPGCVPQKTPDYHTPRTTLVQPKIFPSDFRIVRAAGVFRSQVSVFSFGGLSPALVTRRKSPLC